MLDALATGERRAAYLPARPPDDLYERWTLDPAHGLGRPSALSAIRDGSANGGSPAAKARVSGQLSFVPDAPGADLLVGVALLDGQPIGIAIDASAPEVSIEAVQGYDATRSLGHVTLKDAPATVLDAPSSPSPAPGTSRRR